MVQEQMEKASPEKEQKAEAVKKEAGQEKSVSAVKEVESKEQTEIKLSKAAQEVVKSIEGMSVLELSNLVKVLEDKFGVSASVPVLAAGAGPTPGAGPQEEEKTTFTAELSKVGANKIQVIKEIRTVTNLGLKEAKDLVDSAPKPIKEDINKEEAEEIKKKLAAVGATVELK